MVIDGSFESNPFLLVAAKQFNVARFTSDAMEVITDPEVDAVWICSPSQYHAEQIKAAAANGKHVFCEKPLATDLSETVEAINACNEAGVKLMTGLQRRFDDNFRRVKTAVQNKEVGEPIMVRMLSSFRRRVDWSAFRDWTNLFPRRSNCALATLPLHRSSTSRVVAGSSRTWLSMTWT